VVGGTAEVFSESIVVGALSWARSAPLGPFRAEVRVRHRHCPAPAELTPREDGAIQVRFDAPQRAPAPGQAAVFYDGAELLGGGTILNGGAS
ncbi:MAG: aminomethyltransferase beta-barrel domain-containing protein, partial [Elusimicrobiota bacterium]